VGYEHANHLENNVKIVLTTKQETELRIVFDRKSTSEKSVAQGLRFGTS